MMRYRPVFLAVMLGQAASSEANGQAQVKKTVTDDLAEYARSQAVGRSGAAAGWTRDAIPRYLDWLARLKR